MKGGQKPIHIQRWAPADYQNDEYVRLLYARRDWRTLTFYRTFLDVAFMKGGDLPAEPEALAASLSMPRSDVTKALAFCIDRLVFEEGGRLYQKRVRREVAGELEFRASEAERKRLARECESAGCPPDVRRTQHGHPGRVRGVSKAPAPAPLPLPSPAPSPASRTGGGGRRSSQKKNPPPGSGGKGEEGNGVCGEVIAVYHARLPEYEPNSSMVAGLLRDADLPPEVVARLPEILTFAFDNGRPGKFKDFLADLPTKHLPAWDEKRNARRQSAIRDLRELRSRYISFDDAISSEESCDRSVEWMKWIDPDREKVRAMFDAMPKGAKEA